LQVSVTRYHLVAVLCFHISTFSFTAALAVGVLRLDDEETTSTWSILDCPKGRNKIRDMVLSSSQSTIKFFAKLTSCNCLNDMVQEVKAQAKMGQCIHCDETKERREMFLCGR
jgi:hypothetical protein